MGFVLQDLLHPLPPQVLSTVPSMCENFEQFIG